MSNFKLLFNNFKRNKFQKFFILITTIIFFAGHLYFLLVSIESIKNGYDSSIDFMYSTIVLLKFLVIIFVFLSYECFLKINACRETVDICKKGIVSVYKTELCLFFCYIFLLTFITLIFNMLFTVLNGQLDALIVFHIVSRVLCYYILCLVSSVFIGLMLSFIKKRFIAYIIMLLFAVSEIEMIEIISTYLAESYGINFSKLFEFFFLVPHSVSSMPNYLTCLILDFNKISLLLFYIVLSVLIVVIATVKSQKEKAIKGAACSVLCFTLLAGYFMPVSNPKYDLSASGSISSDSTYYLYYKDCVKEEAADFAVEKYNLKLSARLNLKADATVYVDNKNLDEYKFTLYHKYKVLEVTNQNNKKLDFAQDCDYLTIYSSGQTEYLNIKYYECGGYSQYYSSYTGINLPGNFYFYPVAGFHKMYEDLFCFVCRELPEETVFEVEFDYPKTVYSNLDEVGKNTFSGVSKSLTLLSGYYKTEKIEDTVVYYPYMSKEYKAADLHKYLDDFIKENSNIKKIFFINSNSMRYSGTRTYDDYLFSQEKFDIDQHSFESRIDYTKWPFFTLVREYYDPNTEPEFLQHTEENADAEEKKQIAVLKALFASENREEATAEIVEYLTDGKDMRTPSEFLFELGEKYA